MSSGGHRSKNT